MKDIEERLTVTPSGVDSELKCTPYGDWSPGVPPVVPTFSFPISSQELFKELRTKDEKGPHSKWKSFEHYRKDVSGLSTLQPVAHLVDNYIPSWPNSGDRYHEIVHRDPFYGWWLSESGPNVFKPEEGLPAFYDLTIKNGAFVPPPGDLDQLIRMAIAAMVPKIRAELSIVNTLLELRDFKSLYRDLVNAKSLLLGKVITRQNRTLNQIRRSSAGGYLQYQFNIAPLVSDIRAIHKALSTTTRRINAFIDRAGRLRTSHFTRTLHEYAPYSEYSHAFVLGPSEPWYPPMKGNRSSRRVYTEPTIFHAEMKFNYNYTSYQLANAQALALLDALGINFNPAIIWNAIPWSFVVDWFVSVGRWLDTFKASNMEPKINILDFCWSVRRVRRITAVALRSSWDSSPTHRPAGSSMPTVTETAYRRQAGRPSYQTLLASGLNSKEFTLGAALVLSRRRRVRANTHTKNK